MDAHLPQLSHRPGAVRLDGIGHGDHAQQGPIPGKEQGGLARLGQGIRPLPGLGGDSGLLGQKAQAAAHQGLAAQLGRQAVAGQGSEVLRLRRGTTLRPAFCQDGPGQRVLAAGLQRQGNLHQCFLRHTGSGQKVGHLGLAGGDGARLVQGHHFDFPRLLQGDGGFEQDAVSGPQAAAHHDGHGGSQTQGAGAADDQHRNAPGQGKAEALTQKQPHGGGNDGDGDDRGHEHPGHLVGELGDGGLGGRRIPHHLNDLGQGGVLPHPQGPAAEIAGLVDGGGGHLVPGGLIRRDALAGEGRLVHRAGPLFHHAVHWDALPRLHHEQVSGLHLLHRDGDLLPRPQQHRRLGGQAHQALQGIGGLALGPGLQQLAHGDQGEDHGGGLEIKLVHQLHHPVHIAVELGIGHEKQGGHAPHKGGGGAQSYQGVHVGGPAPQALIAADEKPLVDDQDDARQQQLDQAHGHVVPVEPAGQGPPPHHVPHGEVHQRQQKNHRRCQPPFEPGGLVVGQGLLPGGGRGALSRSLHAGPIARRLHCGHDGLRRGRALHAHGVGEQAHRAGGDTGDLTHRLFHPGRAGGAAHPGHVVLFHATPSFLCLYLISFCIVVTSSSITSSFPSRMSRATQVRMWLASSSLLNALMAALTAADWMRMSLQ